MKLRSLLAVLLVALQAVLSSTGQHAADAGQSKGNNSSSEFSDEDPQHQACHSYLTVEENWDPAGNPGMLPCATSDAELENFYKEAMEPDLEFWRQRAPLNKSRIEAFMDRWKNGGVFQQSMILIYKNKWYYPFLSAWNHSQKTNDQNEEGITLWITATQYYFQQMSAEMEFPDTFFFLSDQDNGWCESGDSGSCPIPALSITKNVQQGKVDLLFPFMVGSEHPMYNYPFQLKHNRAFFNGRANWGGSPKFFNVSGQMERFWSREYLANLSMRHPEKLISSLFTFEPQRYPGMRTSNSDVHMRDHARWKFLLHLDGTTYAFRLSRIMHTNSVILKEETNWYEYFVRALKEGVHYIPIFKTGPDDVLDVIEQWQNRTLDLQRIVYNSQQFTLRYLCPSARMLYFRRLLQEYKGLFNDNGRNAMQDFIEENLVPIVRAREKGDMNTTYMGITPYAPPGHRRRRLSRPRDDDRA